MEISKLLMHMAWANQEIFGKVSELPDEALDSYLVNPEWTAREILRHITSSATWYGYRLLDQSTLTDEAKSAWKGKLDETNTAPATTNEVRGLMQKVAAADAELLAASQLPEGVVTRELDGKIITRARSTVISQSIHHATEHRAQLIAALEFRGYKTINLDDFDLWSYSSTINE